MWETGYYVNTGIQLAFILQFPYLYSILFDIYFYTLTLTYRAFYNNNLKSTVCYTTAPLATNDLLSAKRKPFSARQSSSQPKESLRVNIVTVFPHIVSAETILFWIWKSKGHST